MRTIGERLPRLIRDDHGQDLIEYALLSAFVALVCVAGATTLGTALNGWYSATADGVNSHASSVGS